jgi:hypothetical protein
VKIKNVLFFTLCLLVSKSALALRIEIQNVTGQAIDIDPIWTNSTRGFSYLQPAKILPFNSHIHTLRGLMVKNDNKCVWYDLALKSLRGTGSIKILVYDHSITVLGATDVLFKKNTAVNFSIAGHPFDCN